MSAWSELFDELMTPSASDETPYERLVIALAHVILGAALASVLPVWLVIVIYVLKEAWDVSRGGSARDSLWDTAAVVLGTFYGPAWWPIAAIILALGHALDEG